MLSRFILWAINGPAADGEARPTSALRWWTEDRCWDVRFWLAARLEGVLDRLYGVNDGSLIEPPPLVRVNAPAPVEMDLSLDVAAEAFAPGWDAASPAPLLPPSSPSRLPTPEELAAMVASIRDEQANDGMATVIARELDLDWAEVRQRIAAVPPNHRYLLDTPQGWSAVGDWVFCELNGCVPDAPPLMPSLH